MSEHIIDLTTKEFDSKIKKGKWIVEFGAEWCGPCKIMAPIFDSVSKELHNNIGFGNVDVDENGELAERFEVMSVPTIIFFNNAEIVDIVNGVISKEELMKRAKEI